MPVGGMTCEEHDAALCQILHVKGPKYGDPVSGTLVYDGRDGKNIYLTTPSRLTPEQREAQIEYVREENQK